MSAIEQTHATCMPPEAYIRLWKSAKDSPPPKFMSSFYPEKEIKTKSLTKVLRNLLVEDRNT